MSKSAEDTHAADDIAEIQGLRRAIKQVLGTASNPDHAVSTLLLLIAETIRQAPPGDRKALFVDITGRIWAGVKLPETTSNPVDKAH